MSPEVKLHLHLEYAPSFADVLHSAFLERRFSSVVVLHEDEPKHRMVMPVRWRLQDAFRECPAWLKDQLQHPSHRQ